MDRIPILRMGRFLLVTVQVDMHDQVALNLQSDLTERIVTDKARGVLIDISGLQMVDSFIGRMLANIVAMARVLDAETVVVGMQPAVAITLIELGMELPGINTALNVEAGMDLIRKQMDLKGRDHGRVSWHLRWSSRPRSSRRRANWHATHWYTVAAGEFAWSW